MCSHAQYWSKVIGLLDSVAHDRSSDTFKAELLTIIVCSAEHLPSTGTQAIHHCKDEAAILRNIDESMSEAKQLRLYLGQPKIV